MTDNYLWIPETSDNVVPGLDNVNNTINTEIQNLQTEINHIEISNPGTGDVSKESHYHTSHTGFMFKRNTTNNDNRNTQCFKTIISHFNDNVILIV